MNVSPFYTCARGDRPRGGSVSSGNEGGVTKAEFVVRHLSGNPRQLVHSRADLGDISHLAFFSNYFEPYHAVHAFTPSVP